jgi:hypothetical protein
LDQVRRGIDWLEAILVHDFMDQGMSKDSLFTVDSSSAPLNARLSRVEGAVPYLRRATQVYSSSSVKAPSSNSVNPVQHPSAGSGQISPTAGITAVGSAYPPVISGNFGFVGNANSITVYWDGTNGSILISLKRADGSNYTIPPSSLTVTGLSPSTTYGFLPFNNLTSQQHLSFTVGDIGFPQFAFSPSASPALIAVANQTQQMASNEAVTTSFIYFATPASGTSSGQGLPGTISAYPGRNTPP